MAIGGVSNLRTALTSGVQSMTGGSSTAAKVLLAAVAGSAFVGPMMMMGMGGMGMGMLNPMMMMGSQALMGGMGGFGLGNLAAGGLQGAAYATQALGLNGGAPGLNLSHTAQIMSGAPGFGGATFQQNMAMYMAQGFKPEDARMMAFQEEQQRYNRMLTLMTNLLQMKHEGLKSIVQNMRA